MAESEKKDGLFSALAKLRGEAKPEKNYNYPIQAPNLPKGVIPEGVKSMVAEDSACAPSYEYSRSMMLAGAEGFVGFPGYPYLAMLSTRAEYRNFASAMSTEITREWIVLNSTETAGASTKKKITELNKAIEDIGLRDAIAKMVEHDSFYGKAQLFLDLGPDIDRELPLVISPKTIKKGIKKFRVKPVEPMWTSPSAYNAIDPAAPDFYKPTSYFMLGKKVHASRLLTVVTREVADMLKPAFNFGGMSMSQLAEPSVDNWLRTRQSVSDLISNFSIVNLATSMDQVLQGNDNGDDLFKRVELFTLTRNNKGCMVTDKDREELTMLNAPLGGLDALQGQSQEQQCSVSHIPAVVLLGISPTGFGNVAEGEMNAFRNRLKGEQISFWSKPVRTVINILQLILYGEIDPDIMVAWEPLYQMTPKELSEIRSADAQTAATLIDRSVIDAQEERERLASDPASGYQGLDTGKIIEPPESGGNENNEETLDK